MCSNDPDEHVQTPAESFWRQASLISFSSTSSMGGTDARGTSDVVPVEGQSDGEVGLGGGALAREAN